MTIAEYQNLTGTTVPAADTTRVNAVIRRCQAKLETLLGYSLSKPNEWTELGKVQYSGLVPFPSLPVSDEVLDNLAAADEQSGGIQVFTFDELDKHIRINPAKEVYRAKIAIPVNSTEFITIVDLDNALPYLNDAGLVVAITRYYNWFTWTWWDLLSPLDRSNMLLAVDGDYVDLCDVNQYAELNYLLADMVTYYSDPAYSMLGNIVQETIDTHSYTRADRSNTNSTAESRAPEHQPSAKMLIEKYSGPAVFRKLVR